MFEFSVKQYPRIREDILKLRQIKLQKEEQELIEAYARELGYKFTNGKIPLIGVKGRSMHIQREHKDNLFAVTELPKWDNEDIVGSIIVKEDLTAALGWFGLVRQVNKDVFSKLLIRHLQRVPKEKTKLLFHPPEPTPINMNKLCGLRFLEGCNVDIEMSY